jgi:hypothetical protein
MTRKVIGGISAAALLTIVLVATVFAGSGKLRSLGPAELIVPTETPTDVPTPTPTITPTLAPTEAPTVTPIVLTYFDIGMAIGAGDTIVGPARQFGSQSTFCLIAQFSSAVADADVSFQILDGNSNVVQSGPLGDLADNPGIAFVYAPGGFARQLLKFPTPPAAFTAQVLYGGQVYGSIVFTYLG